MFTVGLTSVVKTHTDTILHTHLHSSLVDTDIFCAHAQREVGNWARL